MNTNPRAKKVLCYGDSNTFGQHPDKLHRYPANVRWTGVLQQLLGDDYYVIEEGLGSRTTDLDYVRKPGRNGKEYFTPCLQSHKALDIVVIMLGTNDLKIEYRRSAREIAEALGGLVDDAREYGVDLNSAPPTVILVSPILIDESAPYFYKFYTEYYDKESMSESSKLADEVRRVADEKHAIFVDAAQVARAGEDGVHFLEASERPFAERIRDVVVHNL